MTIIVTGGAGFIGSNFIFYMMKKYPDYRIICLDKLTYAGNLSTLAPVMDKPNFRFVKMDICDRDAVYGLFEEEHPDVVVFRRHKKVYGEGVTDVRQRRLKTERFDSGIDYMSRRSMFAGVWSYMFRREILDGERFLPGIYHEDEDFTPRLFARSGSLISTNLMVYAYYQRQESIVNSGNADRIKKRFSDMLVVIDRLEEQERASEEELSRYAFHRRKEQFALSVVYQAMRLLPGKEAVADVLRQLADRHCWPLPKARYTWRYSLFRHLTDREWKINVLRQLLKRK